MEEIARQRYRRYVIGIIERANQGFHGGQTSPRMNDAMHSQSARAANAPAMQFTRYSSVLHRRRRWFLRIFLHALSVVHANFASRRECLPDFSLGVKMEIKKMVYIEILLSRVGWEWRDCGYFFFFLILSRTRIEIVRIVKSNFKNE